MAWLVYIIQCRDDRLYTGITTDIERRLSEHGTSRGAKFLRGRPPQRLVYLEPQPCRSTASRREAQIKAMTRRAKLRLIAEQGLHATAPAGG